MAQIRGVHIETLKSPILYSFEQIEKACAVAYLMGRGKLTLLEPPEGWEPPEEDESE